eukprot:TRINITY_DN6362_c0_g1_i1.p1 TRINITY_DN6362_c0_g1~~TRINITY_DN6362_c0_g1_i1.p1  ORF type:complete len:213 (-),score=49.95 TRINITY_DN6362_c0_g1_i1:4-642(-)
MTEQDTGRKLVKIVDDCAYEISDVLKCFSDPSNAGKCSKQGDQLGLCMMRIICPEEMKRARECMQSGQQSCESIYEEAVSRYRSFFDRIPFLMQGHQAEKLASCSSAVIESNKCLASGKQCQEELMKAVSCVAGVVAPSEHNRFMNCMSRNNYKHELCRDEGDKMSKAVEEASEKQARSFGFTPEQMNESVAKKMEDLVRALSYGNGNNPNQ